MKGIHNVVSIDSVTFLHHNPRSNDGTDQDIDMQNANYQNDEGRTDKNRAHMIRKFPSATYN